MIYRFEILGFGFSGLKGFNRQYHQASPWLNQSNFKCHAYPFVTARQRRRPRSMQAAGQRAFHLLRRPKSLHPFPTMPPCSSRLLLGRLRWDLRTRRLLQPPGRTPRKVSSLSFHASSSSGPLSYRGQHPIEPQTLGITGIAKILPLLATVTFQCP